MLASSGSDPGTYHSNIPFIKKREFFIDNPLVQIHFLVEMTLVDRPCAMVI